MHAKRTVFACDECGLLFVHPQPTPEELTAHYAPGGKWQIKKQKPPNPALEALLAAHHVLEHLGRPLDTLRELAGALKPGGHCLVSVPRIDTLDVHRDVGYCLQSRTHIVGFPEACLTDLLARVGLGLVEALHGLDTALTSGRPSLLRLLARKGAPAVLKDDPIGRTPHGDGKRRTAMADVTAPD